MKGNQHRKLYRCDYWGWRWYCSTAALSVKRWDKRKAKKAARIDRKRIEEREVSE